MYICTSPSPNPVTEYENYLLSLFNTKTKIAMPNKNKIPTEYVKLTNRKKNMYVQYLLAIKLLQQ